MRISGTWDPTEMTAEKAETGKQAVLAAYEAGYTLFDHADIYGGTSCETLFGKILKEVPSMRKAILIATKCGIRWAGDAGAKSTHRWDFSAEHILRSCEGSLKRLGVETIDLYQLHRPDYLADPHEITRAFVQLKKEGKVQEFGVSNFRPSLFAAVQKACPFPLLVNQVEIHLCRLDCFEDGTLDQCLEREITPLAWSPLAKGLLGTGAVPDATDANYEKRVELLKVLDEVAGEYGVSREVMALAWLMKHPSKIIPIVGSVKPERIRDAAKADQVKLSREDWYRVMIAARGERLP